MGIFTLNIFLIVSLTILLNFVLIKVDGQESNEVDSLEELETGTRALSNCSCGVRKKQRIVGGTAVESSNEIPWQCTILYRTLQGFESKTRNVFYSYGFLCGCTIIDKKWVLTAAHCVANDESIPYVLAGVNHLTPTEQDPMSQPIRVKKFYRHPDYDSVTNDNDIALLELDQDLPFGDNISAACLPYKHRRNKFYKESAYTCGFGITNHGSNNVSEILQEVNMPILTTKQCRNSYSRASHIKITDQMFCTYSPGKDACQGDSGSGLHYLDKIDGRTYIIGIVSWGVGCATTYPGVYAKISKYLSFIEDNAGKRFCRA